MQRLALSQDGAVLLGASGGELYAWDCKKSRLRWRITASKAAIVALGVGDERVAYHLGFGPLLFIDLETGARKGGVGSLKSVTSLIIDPRDRWVWLGSGAGFLRREVPGSSNSWSRRGMANGGVTCLAQDAKGKTLAVGGRDGSVRFVGAKSANPDRKKILEGHPAPVTAVTLEPRGKVVISGSELGDIRIWTVLSGKQKRLLSGHDSAVRALAVDPKGRRLASGDADGVVHVWDLKKGTLLETFQDPEGGAVTGLVFLHKGLELAVASQRAPLALWTLPRL